MCTSKSVCVDGLLPSSCCSTAVCLVWICATGRFQVIEPSLASSSGTIHAKLNPTADHQTKSDQDDNTTN
jgi:hypothetical protein